MKTILVSGASGIVGYGVLKSLKELNCRLIATTIYSDSAANCFSDVFEIAPKTIDENYIDWLLGIIAKYSVDMIIPGIEADMIKWNENREILKKSGVTLLLNNHDLIKLCSDKWGFYKEIKDTKYAIESRIAGTFDDFKRDFGLPFLLKPRRGFASKGIVKVDNEHLFNEHKNNIGKILMVQPIVGNDDEEFTVSGFFDGKSKLICCQQLKRKLSKEGFTEIAHTANLEGVESVLKELAEMLKPIGPTNFQFRIDNGILKLLEINPRISSSTSIRAAFGYNESKMCVEYFLDKKTPQQPKLKEGSATRYTEDFIKYDCNNI